MSGGHFDYDQYRIECMAETVESIVRQNKKPKPYDELARWEKEEYDPKDPPLYHNYRQDTIREFRKAIKCLRKAYVYVQRIDWLLSGDDGEDTFHERLKEDLEKLA